MKEHSGIYILKKPITDMRGRRWVKIGRGDAEQRIKDHELNNMADDEWVIELKGEFATKAESIAHEKLMKNFIAALPADRRKGRSRERAKMTDSEIEHLCDVTLIALGEERCPIWLYELRKTPTTIDCWQCGRLAGHDHSECAAYRTLQLSPHRRGTQFIIGIPGHPGHWLNPKLMADWQEHSVAEQQALVHSHIMSRKERDVLQSSTVRAG